MFNFNPIDYAPVGKSELIPTSDAELEMPPAETASEAIPPDFSAFPQEISVISTDADWVYVNVLFLASLQNSNAKFYKKLKFCKRGLLGQMMCELEKPATVVEAIKPNNNIDQRLRELAGIPHSRNYV